MMQKSSVFQVRLGVKQKFWIPTELHTINHMFCALNESLVCGDSMLPSFLKCAKIIFFSICYLHSPRSVKKNAINFIIITNFVKLKVMVHQQCSLRRFLLCFRKNFEEQESCAPPIAVAPLQEF